jgi:hypothetical protein
MFPGSRWCICWVCFGYSASLCHVCQTHMCNMETGRHFSSTNTWIVLCHLNNIVFLFHTLSHWMFSKWHIQIWATFMQLLMNSTKHTSVWDCLLWKSCQYSSTAASVLALQILCTKCKYMCSFKNVNGTFTVTFSNNVIVWYNAHA